MFAIYTRGNRALQLDFVAMAAQIILATVLASETTIGLISLFRTRWYIPPPTRLAGTGVAILLSLYFFSLEIYSKPYFFAILKL